MSKFVWLLNRLRRSIGVEVWSYTMLGLLTAVGASLSARVIHFEPPFDVDAAAVDGLLTVIASSMLAVATFASTGLATAFNAATSNGTARATPLLTENRVVQSALASFVGSFVFSIVALVALKVGTFGAQERFVFLVVTIAVICLIVVALLRLIGLLTRLGRVDDTNQRLENATADSMRTRLQHPFLGGIHAEPSGENTESSPADPNRAADPSGAAIVDCQQVGYVEFIDVAHLDAVAASHDVVLQLLVLPGKFVYRGSPLVAVESLAEAQPIPPGIVHAVRDSFSVGSLRTFDQDPRFGLITLSEVAQRAMSPAVNDPGTAIDVIGRQTRLLTRWGDGDDPAADPPHYRRLRVPALRVEDLYEDAFNLIGREAAGHIEVAIRLLKALGALARYGPPQAQAAARAQFDLAYARAIDALPTDAERQRLRLVADEERDPLADVT